ncbi:MAG: O-antigen ligase family protein [Chloroflexi bacterium]|nr:O-antigen ligase family protein [Chloroflexota bacterium]
MGSLQSTKSSGRPSSFLYYLLRPWMLLYHPAARPFLELVVASGVGFAIAVLVIVSTYYIGNPKVVVGAIGGVFYVFMIRRWPYLGILSVVAITSGTIDREWLPLIPIGPFSAHIPDIMLGLLLLLLILRATTQKDFRFYQTPLDVPMLLFMIALFFSMFYGVIFRDLGPNPVVRVARPLFYWLIFFPITQFITDKKTLRNFLYGLMGLALVLSVGLMFPNRFLPFLPVSSVDLTTAGREFSGVTRIYYGGERYLYMIIPAMLATLILYRKGRWLRFLVLFGAIFWLYRSYQRNYWATTIVNLMLMIGLLTTFSKTRLKTITRIASAIPILIILGLGVYVAFPAEVGGQVAIYADRLGSIFQTASNERADSSLEWRSMENYYAKQSIRDHLWLGLGPSGTYRPPFEIEVRANEYPINWYVHNSYLWMTVMMGLSGLVPFLWLSLQYILRTLWRWTELRDDEFIGVYIGFGVGYVGMMISNVVAPNFVQSWSLIIYPLAMAVNEVIYRLNKQELEQVEQQQEISLARRMRAAR